MSNLMDCCAHPSQHNLLEVKYEIVDGNHVAIPCWNRICMHCYTHWYGHPDNLKKFTRKEWDDYINSGWDTP